MKWTVARVPQPVARSVRAKLRYLTELLGWSTIEPLEDTPLVLTAVADLTQKMMVGQRMETIQLIRARAEKLRRSSDHDDLVAAGELDDLAVELEAPIARDEPVEGG